MSILSPEISYSHAKAYSLVLQEIGPKLWIIFYILPHCNLHFIVYNIPRCFSFNDTKINCVNITDLISSDEPISK